MSSYKEIVTKAVIGKCRKQDKQNFKIMTDEIPNTVLGCWVINHKFSGVNVQNNVKVNGSFDVNVWYSYDNDTKTTVSTKRVNYDQDVVVRVKDPAQLNNNEIIVRSLKQPTVTDVKINDNVVSLDIEKELGIEIIGESKVKIAIEDDELPWDDEFKEEINEELDEEYIKEDN